MTFPKCRETGCEHLSHRECEQKECYVFARSTTICVHFDPPGNLTYATTDHAKCPGKVVYLKNLSGWADCHCPCHPHSPYHSEAITKKVEPPICSCSSRDLFNFGCRCGNLALIKLC